MAVETLNTVVILGAGQAGGWVAKSLRDSGFTGRIVLIGDEVHPPHERPPLSKAVLAGTAEASATHLFKPALFASLGLDWRHSSRAIAIDREQQTVELASRERVSYDRLVICTGGRARRLNVSGSETVPVHTLRSIDDATALRGVLRSSRRLLVVGGGWIGLEVAATARKLGVDVHVLEAMDRLCARVLPAAISDYLVGLHRQHQVAISFNKTMSRLERRPEGTVVATISDGSELETDCVVAGIGMVPNDELAQRAGLACDRGIVVDTHCATSDPRVFAAGDVTISPNAHAGQQVRLESWQNAQDQAIAAARAVLGQDVHYDPVPKFWSDQYNANIQILGWPRSSDEIVVRGSLESNQFVAFTVDEGRVRAAVAVNAARELRAARKLVESRARVDVSTLCDSSGDLTKAALTL